MTPEEKTKKIEQLVQDYQAKLEAVFKEYKENIRRIVSEENQGQLNEFWKGEEK